MRSYYRSKGHYLPFEKNNIGDGQTNKHRSGMAEPRVVRALLEKAYCQTDPAVRFLEIFCSIIRCFQ